VSLARSQGRENRVTSRTLTLPAPVTKNALRALHWSSRNRIAKEWQTAIWAQVNTRPRWPRNVGPVTIDIDVVWSKPGPMPDEVNLDYAIELVCDGLVTACVLEHDRTGIRRGALTLRRGPNARTDATVTWGDAME